MASDLKTSILQTIAFFDLFDYPLTAEEVLEYLYGTQRPVHIKEVRGLLNEMEGVTEHLRDYYVLKGRGKLIDTRKGRKFIAEKFWTQVRQYGQYVAGVPFVEMVAVCNNLAYDNASEQSDIDLFIVIREGRMWLARLLITLITQFFGVRRHGDKVAGRFCLSFFVTPKRLGMGTLLQKPEDPYLAYWTKWLAPVYGEESYRKFTEENRVWLKQSYGLNFTEENLKRITFRGKSGTKKFFEWLWNDKLGDWTENLIKKIWKPRTSKHAAALGPEANVVVNDDTLKFHNKDRRKEYLERWQTTVQLALEDLKRMETERQKQIEQAIQEKAHE
jgi:hypothetical protein